jgi:hypothetical protein
MDDAAAIARRMWTLFEPVHVVTYFSPEGREAFEQAGLRGFWRGYFAGRAAPLGALGAAPVIATFFVFAPAMVSRAVPAVWDLASPAEALQARQAGAVAAIRRLLGLAPGDPVPAGVAAVADGMAAAVSELDTAGRTLAASNAALPMPAEPLARLWHAATVLREHRGDGHMAALVTAGIGGAEALALRGGVDKAADASHVVPAWTRDQMQPARGWTDEQWDEAVRRLTDRGLLDGHAAATQAGVARHRDIERWTDQAAAGPWERLGPERTARLAGQLGPISRACATVLPFPNPVGVPAPVGSPAPAS